MKAGMIFECGPEGADKKVCETLAKRHILAPGDVVVPITNLNKPDLIQNCGRQAKMLLQADLCDLVLIVWDLTPPRGACLGGDRDAVFASLAAAGLPNDAPVYTVCVSAELEAWLLADEKALSAYLSTPAHPVRVPRVRYPDREPNPKKRLSKLFGSRGPYNDLVHAGPIAAKVTSLSRLAKVSSFERFQDILTGTYVPGPRP